MKKIEQLNVKCIVNGSSLARDDGAVALCDMVCDVL